MTKAEGKYFEFDDEDQINPDFLETFSRQQNKIMYTGNDSPRAGPTKESKH